MAPYLFAEKDGCKWLFILLSYSYLVCSYTAVSPSLHLLTLLACLVFKSIMGPLEVSNLAALAEIISIEECQVVWFVQEIMQYPKRDSGPTTDSNRYVDDANMESIWRRCPSIPLSTERFHVQLMSGHTCDNEVWGNLSLCDCTIVLDDRGMLQWAKDINL